jgi:polysaccharide pyruvyl transferase CsaB
MSDPRKVVLVGNFGAINLGDEILLATVARWVADAGAAPVAISTDVEQTRSTHAIDAVYYADAAAIVEAIADADLVVLAGGGLFQDYDELDPAALQRFPAFGVTQFAQYVYLAHALGVPCLALAQGVGPLRSEGARGIVAEVFSRTVAGSVRDRDSAALLAQIGVQAAPLVAPDPAWAWTPQPVAFAMPPALQARKVLAVNVRDWAFEAGWEDALAAALAAGLPADWGCLWLDFHVPAPGATVARDAAAHRIVDAMTRLGKASPHAFWAGTTADEAFAAFAACTAAVTMRLHAALLAHRAHLPTVALEYDAKVAALGEDIGVPAWQRIPLAQVAARLPESLARLTSSEGPAFAVSEAALEQRAIAAQAHRVLLHATLMNAASRVPAPDGTETAWVSEWWPGDDAAHRVVRALAHRVRYVSEREKATRGDLDRAVAQLRQAIAERDAQNEARAAAEAAQAASAARLDAIVRSRSYRALAPLRRVSQWRARLATRAKK